MHPVCLSICHVKIVSGSSIDVPDFFFREGVKKTSENFEIFFQGGGPGGPGGKQGVNRILEGGGSPRGLFRGSWGQVVLGGLGGRFLPD